MKDVPGTTHQPPDVAGHYRQGDLRRKIDEALVRLYPGHAHLPLVEADVEGHVPAAVFRGECRVDERPHRTVRAQQGVA
ncbi:hypothetical protein OG824_27455 [Streptomyces prunicolor]|uniref:hypothetical protein n=1 Tax=Streptomyces prunicolor TaxID=67348 RepID=UPI003EB2E9AD|nr:hypothetical protein [Streptomyces prunicolor]